jgi:hypothetical protein
MAIKGEISEAIKFPSIKNEQEVRLQGVIEAIPAHVRPFIALKKKICLIVFAIYLFKDRLQL